mgnify:CR=1 FL=1
MNKLDFRLPDLLVGILLSVVSNFFLLLFGVTPSVALLAGVLFSSFSVIVVSRFAPKKVLKWLKSVPANVEDFPRLHNVVEGICLNHGLEIPDIYVVESKTGNAAVIADKHSQALIVTTGAIDSLDLMEMEGLAAQLISRCNEKSLPKETIKAFFWRFPIVSMLRGLESNKNKIWTEEVNVARLTRYPPGIQKSIQALVSLGTKIEGVPKSTASLWLMDPDGLEVTKTHDSANRQVAELEEI